MSDFKDIAHKTVAELFDMLKEKHYTVDALSEINHEKDLEIADLKAQLNNMETCYIEKKKQVEELQGRLNKHSECIENLVNQKADYLDRVTKAIAHLDSFDLSQAGMNKLQRSIESALEALRGDSD
ncbi:hypothetical protein [Acinetobacter sp. YH12085]|uniref:hypothetical protein n=1 Tax=Acinetobacter sp. YH12085 TaxID=2601077 RepID=UPI00211DDFBA|nr:hypothetical protein [Acinetobacter sp. YH12085]